MNDFVEYLKEIFEGFGPIEAKRMFGGYGVYHDGLMFGLISNDTLYLKVDDESRPLFESQGLTAFEYLRQGKSMHLSYYEAPPEMLENRHEAARWARLSYEAALRARIAKPSRARKKKS